MRRKAAVRVVLQDDERRAMALGATLLANNDLYCSSPMKGGGQLFKATIHKDGKNHVYLPDLARLLGEPVEPVGQLGRKLRIGSWSGELWPLDWNYGPKDNPVYTNLFLALDDLRQIPSWAIDMWVLGHKDAERVQQTAERVQQTLEQEYRDNRVVLGHVHSDSEPTLLAVAWTFSPELWDEIERFEDNMGVYSMAARSRGEPVVAYEGPSDVIHGATFKRIDYAIKSEEGWTIGIAVDDGGCDSVKAAVLVVDKEDRLHTVFKKAGITDRLFYSTFSGTGPSRYAVPFPFEHVPSDD